jgi:hypothetical protein
MSKYFPVEDRKTSGLVGVVSSRGAQAVSIVEGLILKSLSILIDMGFNSVQTFIVRLEPHHIAPLLEAPCINLTSASLILIVVRI